MIIQPQRKVGTSSRGESMGAPTQPAPQFPAGGPVGQPVNPVDFFRRMPGGGTVFVKPDTSPSEAQ